jgi:hypothetical protein
VKNFNFLFLLLFFYSVTSNGGTGFADRSDGSSVSAGLTESPSKLYMQLVERHNQKDSNYSNHQSCREVFTGNGYRARKKTGGTAKVSQQYMAVMGLNFLRQACRCEESPIRQHLVKSPTSANDVLSQNRYHLNGKAPRTEKELLVNEFAVLYTLGQRESSGKFNEGRDLTMTNVFTKSKQWEAGVFQASADSLELDVSKTDPNQSKSMQSVGPPLTKQVFANYLQTLTSSTSLLDRRLACDLPVLAGNSANKVDVDGSDLHDLFGRRGACSKTVARISSRSKLNPTRISSSNSEDVNCFRGLNKSCPAFAIEYAAVTTRVNRMHWGPLRKLGSETKFNRPYIVPACAGFFEELYENRGNFCELATTRQEAAIHDAETTPPKDEKTDRTDDDTGVMNLESPLPPQLSPPAPQVEKALLHNEGILTAQGSIRSGGTYDVNTQASMTSLKNAISYKAGKLVVDGSEKKVTHGHCSTASYLVLTKAYENLQSQGKLTITPEIAAALTPTDELDGTGIWGRWNANGPGTAMLFKELDLGTNFIDSKLEASVQGATMMEPKAGDFIKIFWSWGGKGDRAVGQSEKGHLAVFKGYNYDSAGKISEVCFWTANQSTGFGDKCVPKSDITHAIFSRLERPENIAKAPDLLKSTPTNSYLKRIGNRPDGKQSSSYETALREVGVLK